MQLQPKEIRVRVNKAQEIQFERMTLASFNDFNGEYVGKSLKSQTDLWKAFVFGRWEYFDLIELRDMETGYINADTLYILSTTDKLADLLNLITKWSADEVTYETVDTNSRLGGGLEKGQVLVRVWWD